MSAFLYVSVISQLDLAVECSVLLCVNGLLGELAGVRILVRLVCSALVLALEASGESGGLAVIPGRAVSSALAAVVAVAVSSGTAVVELGLIGVNYDLSVRLDAGGVAGYALDLSNAAVDYAALIGVHRLQCDLSALLDHLS